MLCCAVCCVLLQLGGLDALKSATLLSWLKDAGFYAMKNVTVDVSSPSIARTAVEQAWLHLLFLWDLLLG